MELRGTMNLAKEALDRKYFESDSSNLNAIDLNILPTQSFSNNLLAISNKMTSSNSNKMCLGIV
jgi:hypothetical protein